MLAGKQTGVDLIFWIIAIRICFYVVGKLNFKRRRNLKTSFFTENLTPVPQENRERENGTESKPPSTEPPTSSPPFQRDPPRTPDKPQWNYPPPPVDIMSGGAAFWQNYSGK